MSRAVTAAVFVLIAFVLSMASYDAGKAQGWRDAERRLQAAAPDGLYTANGKLVGATAHASVKQIQKYAASSEEDPSTLASAIGANDTVLIELRDENGPCKPKDGKCMTSAIERTTRLWRAITSSGGDRWTRD
jgi:hypothetical protein